jgi:hypothetical protein
MNPAAKGPSGGILTKDGRRSTFRKQAEANLPSVEAFKDSALSARFTT